jgi:hypothetical protein
MSLGLLRGDPDYYHRSGPATPLWAACRREMLQERITQGDAHRKTEYEGEAVDVFLERGLRPCPACFQDKES